jgi:superfamily II DNA/RNA helicase
MSFESLGLHPALLRALSDAGYAQPTDVQAQAIPPALQGADLRVSSSTGSGKTASFALPALQRVLTARADNNKRRERGVVHGPRVLVLTPTRELALQVAKATLAYGRHVQGLRVATVVGGVPYGAQLKALRGPLDILIATPGRLIDHLGQGKAVLANVEMLVLDEADRMLDMGFIDDIHHIAAATPQARQTVMYSATFAGHVGRLAQELLADDAQTIAVASHTDAHANIEQRLHWADNLRHKDLLLEHLLTERTVEQAVVFTSTQQQAEGLAERLADMGHAVAALHGGMPQGRRNRVLQGLRQRQLRVLVATDVAARGIDVPTVSHVINYGLPMKPEDYVHRIGRTGRAGRSGLAVTLAERRDLLMIKRIQQFTTQKIPVAQVAGLEPRQPEPQIFAGRPPQGERRPGVKFGHAPSRGSHGAARPGARAPRANERRR